MLMSFMYIIKVVGMVIGSGVIEVLVKLKFCDENKYEYHIGMLLDRIGVDGKLSKLDYGDNPLKFISCWLYSYSVRNNEQ